MGDGASLYPAPDSVHGDAQGIGSLGYAQSAPSILPRILSHAPMLDPYRATRKPSDARQAPEASPGSSSNWIYRTAAQGTNALRAWSASVPSSLIASTVIPPALLSTNLASKPRPLVNRTATRCPLHSLDKYPAMSAPPLSACDLRASYPSDRLLRSSWANLADLARKDTWAGCCRCGIREAPARK